MDGDDAWTIQKNNVMISEIILTSEKFTML